MTDFNNCVNCGAEFEINKQKCPVCGFHLARSPQNSSENNITRRDPWHITSENLRTNNAIQESGPAFTFGGIVLIISCVILFIAGALVLSTMLAIFGLLPCFINHSVRTMSENTAFFICIFFIAASCSAGSFIGYNAGVFLCKKFRLSLRKNPFIVPAKSIYAGYIPALLISLLFSIIYISPDKKLGDLIEILILNLFINFTAAVLTTISIAVRLNRQKLKKYN